MTREFIYFNAKLCKPDPKTRGPKSDHNGQSQTTYPMPNSVMTANAKGQLGKLGNLVTRTALERKFHQCLLEKGAGTMELKIAALTLGTRFKNQNGILCCKLLISEKRKYPVPVIEHNDAKYLVINVAMLEVCSL